MIAEIDKEKAGFYQSQQEKIIFCITVHSIECWLLSHYSPHTPKTPKTKNCEKALRDTLVRHHKQKDKAFEKRQPFYDRLSQPFLKKKTLLKVANKEPSFKLFINQLNRIHYP